MSITLRPYQTDIIENTRALMRGGIKSVLIQSPTGSGKTALTAQMVKNAESKGMASWFIVHRRELIKQSMKTFDKVGVRYGVVAAGFFEAKRMPVQIASIQTLARRVERFIRPKLIIWDECHHVSAGGWSKIFEQFPEAFHVGLTATPERLDGTGLEKYFKQMVAGPSVAWLIENKFLAPYKLFAPASLNLSSVHMRMGDFVNSEITAIVDKPTITGDAIKHYQKYASGKRAVAFCASVEHSKHVVAQFNKAGINAEHIDGETETEIRDGAIRRFEAGDTKVISNVELFGEGFDLPALEVAILLRPTQSLGLYLQQVGRALRPHPGKEQAIILDHAGNCSRHGLPDEERQWSLKGRDARKKDTGAGSGVKICPKCFAAQFPGLPACTFCKFVFEVNGRAVDHVEGELSEVDLDQIRRQKKMEQGKADTLDDLVQLGKQRGYKRPYQWAHHVMQARQARKLAGVK